MNRSLQAALFFLLGFLCEHPLQAKLLINEALVNPGGTIDQPREYVEILSTTSNDSLAGVFLLEIANEILDDDISPGTIVNAIDLSPAAAQIGYTNRGLIVLGEGYSTTNPWGITASDAALLDLNRTSFDLDPTDFDRSGIVDAGDLTVWQSNFGLVGSAVKRHGNADERTGLFETPPNPLAQDLDVDGHDFLEWQRTFGKEANPFGFPGNGLENIDIQNSVALLLVQGFSGVIGDDVDLENDGTLDALLPWSAQLDLITLANVDAGGGDPDVDDYNYFGVAPQEPGQSTPDAMTRLVGNIADSDSSAWFGGEGRQSSSLDKQYTQSATSQTFGFPSGGPYSLTPGDFNEGPLPLASAPVPEPSSYVIALFAIGIFAMARKRNSQFWLIRQIADAYSLEMEKIGGGKSY